MCNTRVVNFIGGPGVGKTLMCALTFGKLKLLGKKVEYIQEYAKKLVWLNDMAKLNDQYYVTLRQFEILNSVVGKVCYIVTDGPPLHGIYYARTNKDNMSNVIKTEKYIMECYNKFNNINIFIERNKETEYETVGRIQTYEEAIKVDIGMLNILKEFNVSYKKFKSSEKEIDNILNYILENNNG